MKRAILFFVAALGMSAATLAQVKFGAKAGLNVSALWGVMEGATTYISIPGPHPPLAGLLAGGYVRYDFREITWLGVQLDLLFSMQGGRNVRYWQMGEQYTIGALRQNYINVPVVLDLKFFRRVPLSFLIGRQDGVCIFRYADGERVRHTEGSIYGWSESAWLFGFRYIFSERLSAELRIINSRTPSIAIDETWFLNTPAPANYVYKSIGAQNLVGQLTVGWTF
jgi:hypothetical protein